MTTTHNVLKTPKLELTLDDDMWFEFEAEVNSYEGPEWKYFGCASTYQGALDAALRIVYAVWTVNPDLAESFASRVCRDIPTAFNEIPR